jgi:hypothetical protein
MIINRYITCETSIAAFGRLFRGEEYLRKIYLCLYLTVTGIRSAFSDKSGAGRCIRDKYQPDIRMSRKQENFSEQSASPLEYFENGRNPYRESHAVYRARYNYLKVSVVLSGGFKIGKTNPNNRLLKII